VKKTALSAYGNPRSAGIIAINLDKGDRLVSVFLTRGNDEIIFASRGGKAIRFSETQLRSQGRATRGVKGMSLKKGDYVVGAVTADDDDTLLTVSENGFGKRTTAGEYRTQNRGGKGLINIQTTQRNGKVVSVLAVHDDEEIMVLTTGGMIMRTPVKKISSIGRNTQGVRIIRLNKGDKVACVAKLAEESAEEGAEEEAAEQ
jgi:DNA gyrase subunit A